MGAYLHLGIVTKFEVNKGKEEKNLPLEFYNVEEKGNLLSYKLKKEILNKESLFKFLEEEYSKFDAYDKEKALSKVESSEDIDSLIEDLKEDGLSSLYILEDMMYGAEIEMICYLSDGKFSMETYDNTLNYSLQAIRKSSDNELIKTVDFWIM